MDFYTPRRTNICYICVCFLAALCRALIVMGNTNKRVYVVSVSDSVFLPCNSKLQDVRNWKFENTFITIDRLFVDFELEESLSLFQNYSLLIKSISLDHEGIYRCLQGNNIVEEYVLEVEVPPRLMVTVNRLSNITEITAEENTVVNATCHAFGAKPAVNLTWTNQEGVDLLQKDAVMTVVENDELHGKKTFGSEITLNVYLDNKNGTITCKSITESGLGNREITLEYNTFALPHVDIKVNGINNRSEVFVPANEPSLFTCYSSRSRPESHLFWLSNEFRLNASLVGNQTIRKWADGTFDTVSSILFTISNITGSITCVSELARGINEYKKKELKIYTYVMPETRMAINGLDATTNVPVIRQVPLSVVCYSYGGRPVVHHSWTANGRPINFTQIENQTDVEMDGSQYVNFNTTSSISYRPDDDNGSIICTSWLGDTGIFKTAYITYHTYDQHFNQQSTQFLKSIFIMLALLLVVAPTAIFVFKKYLGSRSSTFVLNRHPPQENEDTNVSQNLSNDTFTKGASEGDVPSNKRKRSYRDFHGPPKLDLPQVPGTSEISDYCPCGEDDYDSYFELKENSANHKMFPGKDMCLILSMNLGYLRSRWMGTIAISSSQKKCVVFSTVNDITVKSGKIQWDTYVKRVLDMPDNKSLVKLEGVCVNQATLYLVHEHLTCESLESLINAKRSMSRIDDVYASLPTSRVASFIMDILEGMEVLHSFGFLHPGLSTRTVLVTSTDQCKLYNFFLSDDAPNKTSDMKLKKVCSLNDLPPETLLRNEYTEASDVWCVAVILWNLMTNDPIPVVLENLNEKKLINVPQEWPASHLELKNNSFFECWDYDDSLRPSIYKLRSSFSQVRCDAQTLASSEDLQESLTDLYIPMDGISTKNIHPTEMEETSYLTEKSVN